MADSALSLLRNTFNNVTKNNYKRMVLMARDHHDKLKGFAQIDATIDALYQRFLPLFTAFTVLYDTVNSNYTMYQGHTKLFEKYMEELRSTMIRKWDVLIQVEYDQNSAEYTMLMGNGRTVFQTGAYDMRLSAVNQLYNNLLIINNPNLANVVTMIDTWRTTVQAARTQQQYFEAKDKDFRNQLEAARAELAVEMYGVFFGLAAYYYKTPEKVETFYDLKYLQAPTSSTKAANAQKEVTIDANSQKTAFVGDYKITDSFEIENKGDTDIRVWVSNDENSAIPIDAPTINKGNTISFYVDELTDGTTPMKYVIVANPDTISGKCGVTQLE